MAGSMLATAPSSSITAATHLSFGAHGEGNPLKASSVQAPKSSSSLPKLGSRRLVIRAESSSGNANGRRAAVLGLGAALLSAMATSGSANAGLVEDLLAKSAANKDLNDKKRLATSGANIARAYTVQFGTCQVPYNFTGCQDLAKTKGAKFGCRQTLKGGTKSAMGSRENFRDKRHRGLGVSTQAFYYFASGLRVSTQAFYYFASLNLYYKIFWTVFKHHVADL